MSRYPFTTAEGVTFTPWHDGHVVGFRVTREQDDSVEYVLLVPSAEENRQDFDGKADVYVYHTAGGITGADDTPDPVTDGAALIYVPVFDSDEATP